jgi:hypothetical protein
MTRSRDELTPNYTLQRTAGSLMLALRPLSATLSEPRRMKICLIVV